MFFQTLRLAAGRRAGDKPFAAVVPLTVEGLTVGGTCLGGVAFDWGRFLNRGESISIRQPHADAPLRRGAIDVMRQRDVLVDQSDGADKNPLMLRLPRRFFARQ